MSESIVADFVATFNSEASTRSEPARGRVLLSRKRLVLAASEDDKLTIPLSSVFDVAVGSVPPDLGDFFDSTVTVAFERGDRRLVAVVETDDGTVEKFSTVLFKAILNGTETTVKERARVGGRVTDEPFRTARLGVEEGAVRFGRSDGAFRVDLSTVTDFERSTREVGESRRPALTVRHMMDGTAVTTLAAVPTARKLSILGRYLRLEYREVMEALEDLTLTGSQKELLVALYSTGEMSGMPLADVLGTDASEVTMLLSELREDGLVQDGDHGPVLTPMGEVVASRHLEDVNV
jgi:helix-turn-helix protein